MFTALAIFIFVSAALAIGIALGVAVTLTAAKPHRDAVPDAAAVASDIGHASGGASLPGAAFKRAA